MLQAQLAGISVSTTLTLPLLSVSHKRLRNIMSLDLSTYPVTTLTPVHHLNSFPPRSLLSKQFLILQGLGEIAVREIFPETTIVRPPPMFGVEDRLLNPLAAPRFYWTSTSLEKPKLQPAYV